MQVIFRSLLLCPQKMEQTLHKTAMPFPEFCGWQFYTVSMPTSAENSGAIRQKRGQNSEVFDFVSERVEILYGNSKSCK